VAIVDWVGVIVTADILLGFLGMLASLSCGESVWWVLGSGSSSGASCICSIRRSNLSSIGRITLVWSRSPSNGLRSGFSQNMVRARQVAIPLVHSLVVGFRSFW
jgi:hypothetical protein